MLKTPSLIDSFGHVLLLPSFEVGRMKHGDLDPVAKLADQRGEQRGA